LLVGRWTSGAPLIRAPDEDNARLGAASGPNNAFGYLNDDLPLPQIPGVAPDEFPPAGPDPGGRLSPHGAHIRKMDPRDQAPGGSTTGNTLTHLILRRGLTFDHTGAGDPAPAKDKGLVFACYQSSIRQGSVTTEDWVIPNGGGYFFVPSRSTIRDTLTQ
jgi:deferrochelatase/peroxidase EfeB